MAAENLGAAQQLGVMDEPVVDLEYDGTAA